jgi:L-seryl-tRNA(Ser) seleniumtransferase
MQTTGKPGRAPGRAGTGALLRRIPAVSRVLESRSFVRVRRELGDGLATDLLRERLAELREAVRAGRLDAGALEGRIRERALADSVRGAAAALLRPSPRPVINATGVIVHTNLGRSVLSAAAAARVAEAASGYLDLEYDLGDGGRGSRMDHLAPLMERLFPGRGFLVVNNNAAAILLALRALARRKEVPVSRGELVEIGGSFRVPDIMAASGARLCEVGTTNKTRIADYERVLGPKTGMLLKVHTSNFRIVGFSEEAPIDKLAALARDAGVPLVVDWGSGDLVDLAPLGLRDEQPVARILEAGADLVTFSGDKLLGGPQAGFVVGDPKLVERLRRDPLARVCRLDRLLIAALHETLSAYVRGRETEEVPTLRMLALTKQQVGRRASAVRRALESAGVGRGRVRVIDGVSRSGGGSSPTGERPTRLVAIESEGGDAGGLERALRGGDPPIVARVREGVLLLDLRTVRPDQDEVVVRRLTEILT